MNTYDFDQTIFFPDSSYCFVMYCLRRYPLRLLGSLPGVAWTGLKHAIKRAETKELKEQVFSFLPRLEDVDAVVAAFWEENRNRVSQWYLRQKRADDIIISASPEFLLRPMAEELGVKLIATVMDKRTGKISGANCHDHEKVRRFRAEYPGAHTENFYSDSLTDAPMAEIADRAWLVVSDGDVRPWPEKSERAE